MIAIIKQRKIWFIVSTVLVVASLAAILGIGLNLGIDFNGGSLMEIEFNQQVNRPNSAEVTQALAPLAIGDVVTQAVGDNGMILRFKNVDEPTHQQILTTLNQAFVAEGISENIISEKRFDSIGPTIGAELKTKTLWAIGIVLLAIIVYIAWAFRKVSKPVASWKYGLIAIVALFHDVIITLGIFAILGRLYGIEINAPFVAALLTILGYSVNDSIVVFDRTRENLTRDIGSDFEKIVQKSVNEVIVRSINTSFTTLFVLFAILLLGGDTIREFILALIIGIAIGTYSSIFLASPLLVTWERLRSKN